MENSGIEEGLLQALRDHIEKLPALERQILTFKYTEGLPQEKIGKLLAIPQQTISRRIQSALDRLRVSLETAGLASVVPLLSKNGLSEAISSGHFAPNGLAERILNQIAESGAASTGALKSFSSRMPNAAPATTKAPLVNAPPPAIASRVLFERAWNFDAAEGAANFKVIGGSWKYLPQGGVDGSGCMESADGADAVIELDLKEFDADSPLHITFEWQMMTRFRSYRADVRWQKYGEGASIRADGADYNQKNSIWISNHIFITPEFSSTYLDKQLVHIAIAPRKTGSPLQLDLHGGVVRIDNFRISEIRRKEIPDVKEYLDAYLNIEPAQKKDSVLLQGVKAFQDGKPVTAVSTKASE